MFTGKMREDIIAVPSDRSGIPVEVPVDFGIVDLVFRTQFIAEKTWNFIFREHGRHIQHSPDVVF
jgi:hypothetical protein